jgi:aminoglycoside 6'-N-acetyltransferase
MAEIVDREEILSTARLKLEPIRQSHARRLFPILADADIYKFIPPSMPATVAELSDRFHRWQKRQSPDGQAIWLNWAIFLRSARHYIGTMQATITNGNSAFIAYLLSPRHWGNGYAGEACARIINILFNDYQLEKIFAQVDARNAASCRLLARLRFEIIAFHPQADYFYDAFSDEFLFQLTRSRWHQFFPTS